MYMAGQCVTSVNSLYLVCYPYHVWALCQLLRWTESPPNYTSIAESGSVSFTRVPRAFRLEAFP